MFSAVVAEPYLQDNCERTLRTRTTLVTSCALRVQRLCEFPWSRSGRPREASGNLVDSLGTKTVWIAFAIFSLVPGVYSYWWYFREVVPALGGSEPAFTIAIGLAFIWVLIDAPLLVQGDRLLGRALQTLSEESMSGVSWNMQDQDRALRTFDRLGIIPVPVAGAVVACLALLLSRQALQETLPTVGVLYEVGAFAVIAQVGAVSAYGIWGVLKAVRLVIVASKSKNVPWEPFSMTQLKGVESLGEFSLATAWRFSLGSVFVPAIVIAALSGLVAPQAIPLALGFIVLLTAGGLAAFLVPNFYLAKLAHAQEHHALNAIGEKIQSLQREGEHGKPGELQVQILLWRAVRFEHAHSQTMSTLNAASRTLIIPFTGFVIASAIQIWAS